MADAIDYSTTQRILLLIDLNPLLQNPNPNPNYITSILTTSKILLSFPSLSSSLFSFNLFFSSLSPLLSASTLHRLIPNHPSPSISFNSPYQTLISLSDTLNSISSTHFTFSSSSSSSSNCSHTAASLLQLARDYDWSSDVDTFSGKPHHDLMQIRSNLIILLSPVCRSFNGLAEFFSVDVNDHHPWILDDYRAKFRDCFGVVNDAFNSKDIHFCWVGVRSHEEEQQPEINKSEQQSALIADEIRKFGWGFCWTDSIILGSALVSFGLIYPSIVVSSKLADSRRLGKVIRGQLNLEILDVLGKPLECKCCDLELRHLTVSSKPRSDDSSSKNQVTNFGFLRNLNDGILKLHVKAVRRYTKYANSEELSSDRFLVQLAKSGKKEKDCLEPFFADKVLELLADEKSELLEKHRVPTWQIFLAFLYREGYWALLLLSNSNGDSYMGILKPFTVHSSILSVLDYNHFPVKSSGRANLLMVDNVVSQSDMDRQKGTSPTGKYANIGDGRRGKIKKHMHRDLTWNSFCNAAYDLLDVDLAEVYFANGVKKSKKLKFLKCWMKEVKIKSLSYKNRPDGSCHLPPDPNQQKEDVNGNLAANYLESNEPLSKHACSDQSRMQEDAAFVLCSEASEAFFVNLPKKIQHGLESNGVDLKILAERLVSSSIYWLRQKQKTIENSDESCKIQVAEIINLLLHEPKDLKEVHKNNPSHQSLNLGSTSEFLVREYELQILLRMEILQSEYAGNVKGIMKMKLVKQICSLLEIIQYLVEGGFHGDVSLYDYVERTIKTRYLKNLEDVVNKIYERMDLLPFGDENEDQPLMLNSEDSNQSWREKPELASSKMIQDSFSAEDESSHPLENMDKCHDGDMKEDHARKLNEARERRKRARRFVSFTSQMPDLQRVWAPKQLKAMKTRPVSLAKESKRKKQRGACYSVVCETPLSVNEPSRAPRENKDEWGNTCNSVSKALFQDDK